MALALFASAMLLCLTVSSAWAASPDAVELSADGRSARDGALTFAASDVHRMNKGTSKSYEGRSFGYRFPMTDAQSFTVVATSEAVIVHVPREVADRLRLDVEEASVQDGLMRLVRTVDDAIAHGGVPLSTLEVPTLFTTESSLLHGAYCYRFGVVVEPGSSYVCVEVAAAPSLSPSPSPSQEARAEAEEWSQAVPSADNQAAAGNDASAGALFTLSGRLLPVEEVVIQQPASGTDALWEFFYGIDYRPFWVSLRTSLAAMVFVFVLGLAAARLSLKMSSRLRDVLDSIFTIPMVLPPTVCGFLLLMAFGNSTELGRWFTAHGLSLVFSWQSAVLAAFVVAFPLMYRTARGAFEGLDPSIADAARTLGWSNARIFFRLTLPLAWPSIAAGTVLSFARAMGEFGATLFVAGNYAGVTQTMPLAIYYQWMGGRTDIAAFWVVVVILISFAVILLINWYASRTQRYRKPGLDKGGEKGA
ncbi:MAG: molybdate ABC transporter permease subunit [Coriobacteriales bacterium]|nr:molybdate ABC transporter permease subunit [Coriobacteriales bacterium]